MEMDMLVVCGSTCSSDYVCFADVCSSRYFHWQLNLYWMLAMLICVIPLYIAQQLVNTIRIGRCARWGGEGRERERMEGKRGEGEEERGWRKGVKERGKRRGVEEIHV